MEGTEEQDGEEESWKKEVLEESLQNWDVLPFQYIYAY